MPVKRVCNQHLCCKLWSRSGVDQETYLQYYQNILDNRTDPAGQLIDEKLEPLFRRRRRPWGHRGLDWSWCCSTSPRKRKTRLQIDRACCRRTRTSRNQVFRLFFHIHMIIDFGHKADRIRNVHASSYLERDLLLWLLPMPRYQKTSFYDEKTATLKNSRLIAATVQLINR